MPLEVWQVGEMNSLREGGAKPILGGGTTQKLRTRRLGAAAMTTTTDDCYSREKGGRPPFRVFASGLMRRALDMTKIVSNIDL
jgi:hypothetical protein